MAGGARLAGEVTTTGAKNSVLKLMAGALLAEGTTTLTNVPDIIDVPIMSEVLRGLGAEVAGCAPEIRITVPEQLGEQTAYDHVRRIRGSVCVLGPLLARTGRARVALPGGDAIGSRPLDLHVAGLTRLGARIDTEHGYLVARAPRPLAAAEVWLEFPSVGATENIVMAAVLAKGITTVENVAREPEVADLCHLLVAMGARIDGVGASTLVIEGVDRLRPVTHRVVADRIVAGTYAFATVMTRGEVTVRGVNPDHLRMPLEKLEQAGAELEVATNEFRVTMDHRPAAVDVVTLPYPGFPTDLQPMAIALNAIADGTALVTENMFEGRFMFVDELVRFGADVRTDGHHAAVRGRDRLSGAPVRATDIRAGAALVLAGLVGDGITTVTDVHHIDRGYQGFVERLRRLGADITRESIAAGGLLR